jgi:hypothetical protein
LQYVTSLNVSPYCVKGTGEELGVLVDVGGGVGVGVGVVSEAHDKSGKVNAIVNRNTLVFNFERVLISLLLTDGIP